MRRLIVFLVLVINLVGCQPPPPDLTPDAKLAFQATRVVMVLDVVRDAAIAANEQVPPLMTTNDTRNVVLWHKTSVQTIRAVPSGWKPAVMAGLYALTCDARVLVPTASQPCTPQLSAPAVKQLTPYVGLVSVILAEVK